MSSRRGNNGTGSHRPLTRVEEKRILEPPIIDTIDLTNQFSQQDESPSESVPVKPPRQKLGNQWTATIINLSGFENPSKHTSPHVFRRFQGRHHAVPLSSLQQQSRHGSPHPRISHHMAHEQCVQAPHSNRGKHLPDS